MSEKNLSLLFSGLDNIKKTEKILNLYEIKELTLSQQKEILVTVFNRAETPAKLGIALDKIILDSTTILGEEGNPITIVEKPFILRSLRSLSIGDKLIKKEEENDGEVTKEVKKEFELLPINFKNAKKFKKSLEIKIDTNNSIKLVVPSLERDMFFNKVAIQQITSYRKGCEMRKEVPKTGQYAAIYFTIEFMKYIDSIQIGSESFDFRKLAVNEQIRVVDSLPQIISKQISDYIQSVKDLENDCFMAKNLETGEKEKIEIDHLIFSTES